MFFLKIGIWITFNKWDNHDPSKPLIGAIIRPIENKHLTIEFSAVTDFDEETYIFSSIKIVATNTAKNDISSLFEKRHLDRFMEHFFEEFQELDKSNVQTKARRKLVEIPLHLANDLPNFVKKERITQKVEPYNFLFFVILYLLSGFLVTDAVTLVGTIFSFSSLHFLVSLAFPAISSVGGVFKVLPLFVPAILFPISFLFFFGPSLPMT